MGTTEFHQFTKFQDPFGRYDTWVLILKGDKNVTLGDGL